MSFGAVVATGFDWVEVSPEASPGAGGRQGQEQEDGHPRRSDGDVASAGNAGTTSGNLIQPWTA